MLSLQSFLRKGVSLGYPGLNQNLKDLKDLVGKGTSFIRNHSSPRTTVGPYRHPRSGEQRVADPCVQAYM